MNSFVVEDGHTVAGSESDPGSTGPSENCPGGSHVGGAVVGA